MANSRKMPTLCGTNTGQVIVLHIIVIIITFIIITVIIVIIKIVIIMMMVSQHLIYTAIPNFPARLSIVVDTQVKIEKYLLGG